MAKLPDNKIIKELANLLEESSLTEIELEADGVRIRVAREAVPTTVIASATPQTAAPLTQVMAPAPSPAHEATLENPANQAGAVKSPMIGTAYLAPEPDAPNFVATGDNVSAGQTILVIEAMKTMNSIAAPVTGTVKQVLIDNEQPVEFDQVLMIIE